MQEASLKPFLKNRNLTVGVFTPSMPAHIVLSEKFAHGIINLKKLGFKVKLGDLTASGQHQRYRTASAKNRADEFMSLILDDSVDILMSNIGGSNSSSMLPYLDYDKIRSSRKMLVGYSDLTSLQMAILNRSGLRSCYGPAVCPSFGEWPEPDDTASYFLSIINGLTKGPVQVPSKWSNTFRDYADGSWKTKPRIYNNNDGWHAVKSGNVTGRLVLANLATLLSIAGTPYFPNLDNKILLLEEMELSVSMFERRINQLKIMGVFDRIEGLIFSKIEFMDQAYEYAEYENILLEFCIDFNFPILTNFDCGHTTPLISFCQDTEVQLKVDENSSLIVLEEQIEIGRQS